MDATRTIIWLHRWAGLTIGLVFVVAGLTGSVLAYAPELDGLLHPRLAGPPPAGWETARPRLLAAIEARGAEVRLVRFPGPERGAYELWLEQDARLHLDALTGEVVHARRVDDDVLAFTRALHVELLAGERGELVLGWFGVAMLVLLGTGVWLWWPASGRWIGVLRRPASSVLVVQLLWWHRTLGWTGAVLLAFVTLTGVAMVFHSAAQAVLTTALGGTPRSVAREVAPDAAASDWPAILATLDATFPEGRAVYLSPSTDPARAHVFRKRQPAELHPNGRSFVVIDRRGARIDAVDATASALGLRATNAIYPLHSGRTGHPWWQALVALIGVLPLALAITGGWLWWRRSQPGARAGA